MKAAIYGTGSVALELFQELSEKYGEGYITFFIDSMLKRKKFCEKPVYSLQDLSNIDLNEYEYYLGSVSSKKSMKEELLKIGVNEQNIRTDLDFSEDNFQFTIKKVDKLLIYPEPDENKQEHIEKILQQYLGNLKNEISIDYALKGNCLDYDLILIWDYEHLQDKKIAQSKKKFCIDNKFYPTIEERILTRLAYILSDKEKQQKYQDVSKIILKMLKKKEAKAVYIFASGPSLERGIQIFQQKHEQQTIRMVCNAFINAGTEVIKKVEPQIYLLLDILYLSSSYKEIMDKIADYIRQNECYLVVPNFWIPVLQYRYGLNDKIMGIGLEAKSITFLNEDKMVVYNKAANVITTLGIPVASSLATRVLLIGCDGYTNDSSEKVNGWGYSKIASENIEVDLSTRDMCDYQEKHYAYFTEILNYGEKKGIYYESITPSNIPCLRARYKE